MAAGTGGAGAVVGALAAARGADYGSLALMGNAATTVLGRDAGRGFVTGAGLASTERSECISWLAGSYVNLILGLPYTAENLDLLASTLTMSDTLTLRNNVAGTNRYLVTERRHVDVFANGVFRQRRAGLTLVLLGGNGESFDRRLVIWAAPVNSEEEVIATKKD